MGRLSVKYYLAFVAVLVLTVGSYVGLRPVSQPSPPPTPAATAPTKTNSGRDGGSAKAAPSADFPAGFPLPAGTLTGTSGASPSWSVGINIEGNYATVMPAIRDFYKSQGFTDLNADQAIPFGFKNPNFNVQIVGRDRDHTGPMSTDVTIVIRKNQ